MKKIISVLLVIVSLLSLVSCSKEESYGSSTSENTLKYYNPTFFLFEYESDNNAKKTNDGTEPSKEQIEICNNVIEKIFEKYKITKEYPKIKCMPDEYFEITGSLTGTAKYDQISKCILIPKSFDETGKSYFAHEVLHYLSDFGQETIGLEYFIEDGEKKYLVGCSLNEGITNYFSTKVIKHPKDTCIYEYETHAAAELAIVFGEDNLWNAYISGDWKNIKDFFNESVNGLYFEENYQNMKLTPFEIIQITLDEYQFLLAYADGMIQDYGLELWKENFCADVNSMEEMLINSAKEVGKAEEAKKETEKFLKNCSGRIDFKGFTKIEEIAA